MTTQPITANQLRIGNLIKGTYLTEGFEDDSEPKEIECSFMGYDPFNNKIWVDSKSDVDEFESFSGIPLTPEWLERFGFEKSNRFAGVTRFYYGTNEVNGDYDMIVNYSHHSYRYWYKSVAHCMEYVHQLQNLYFALCGQELTIKEVETSK